MDKNKPQQRKKRASFTDWLQKRQTTKKDKPPRKKGDQEKQKKEQEGREARQKERAERKMQQKIEEENQKSSQQRRVSENTQDRIKQRYKNADETRENQKKRFEEKQRKREQEREKQQQKEQDEEKKKRAALRKYEFKTHDADRMDEISQPKKWLLLSTYKEHGYHFEPTRREKIKEKVQEAFALTPEETEMYFASLNKEHPRKSLRLYRAHQRRIQRRVAECQVCQLLLSAVTRAMTYAYCQSPPIFVSPEVRSTADRILEVLCTLHDVPIPKRTDSDTMTTFLINMADWAAIFMFRMYYEIEANEKEDLKKYLEIQAAPEEEDTEENEITGERGREQTINDTDYIGEKMEGEIPKREGEMEEGGEENADVKRAIKDEIGEEEEGG